MQNKIIARVVVIAVLILVVALLDFIPGLLWAYLRAKEELWIVYEALLVNSLVGSFMGFDKIKKLYTKNVARIEKKLNGDITDICEEDEDDEAGDHTERAADEIRGKETGKDLDS